MEKQVYDRIIVNPKIMTGKPVIKGTRIPIDLIVELLAEGLTKEEILEDYPQLKNEDIIALLEKKYDIKFVSEIMPGAEDIEILKYAEKEKRVLITNDKDFGELIFRLKMPSSGVILLRLKKNIPINRIKYTINLIENFSDKLKNNFVVVKEGQVRIR